MERKDLFTLVKNGLNPVVNANFSSEDANTAAINALCENFNIDKNASVRDIKNQIKNVNAMSIIEEAIDELLPARLTDVMGRFAEIKSFARNDEVVFRLTKLGKARARLSVVKGARGGIYKASRLDSSNFQMPTETYTVAVYVTLEEIILGTYTLAELFSNVLDGFEEIVYKEVINALRKARDLAPEANAFTVGTDDNEVTLEAALDSSIKIAKAYGTPIIVGFSTLLNKISNVQGYVATAAGSPTRSVEDVNDIRNYGRVQIYKGTQIVELPNYLVDNTNASWLLSEDMIFVLPAEAKPVKVAYQGELYIVENTQPTGSQKWEAHKIMGVGLALANNVCTVMEG